MKKSTIITFLCFALSLNCTFAEAFAETPGVYMLFVWGTLEPNVKDTTLLSKRRIEDAFKTETTSYDSPYNTRGSLTALNKYIKRVVTLEGEDANPKRILIETLKLSNEAGENDAVVVYVLCHGGVVQGTDGKFRHALAPYAKSNVDLEMGMYGLSRKTLMKAIQYKDHRLNVLITDACGVVLRPEQTDVPRVGTRGSSDPTQQQPPYLVAFLLKARGNLNINSARPGRSASDPHAEKALALKNSNWLEGIPTSETDRDNYELLAGTVFTNAFLEVAKYRGYQDDECDVDHMYELLKRVLLAKFDRYKMYFKENELTGPGRDFLRQRKQTLTRFDGDIPLDD